MSVLSQDEIFMLHALDLAAKGVGWVSPNPMVGAVIVKDARIIGEGWHQKYAEPHAERNALAACTEDPCGATLYVTLEPCCHHGKQPPCTDAVIQAGIQRVVIGSADPNPLVAGKGIALLEAAGITVVQDVLRDACDRLNEVFFHYITTKRPFVALKYAMTMDGKIAAYTGKSQWITGPAAREHVQTLRHRYTGILVGIETVLADDPMLTCRMEGGKNPIRIVCDTHLRISPACKLVRTAWQFPTILATCNSDPNAIAQYESKGCRVLVLPVKDFHLDPDALLTALGAEGIDSILVEGGGRINWSFVERGFVNKVYSYLAPKLLGGDHAKTPVTGQGFPSPEQALPLHNCHMTRLGEDFLIESEVGPCVHGNH